jgi:hypothetical protein
MDEYELLHLEIGNFLLGKQLEKIQVELEEKFKIIKRLMEDTEE